MEMRRIVPAIWSTTATGNRDVAIPSSWLGTPSVSRRTMLGAVRTARKTSVAPPSIRSTAISAPEFPAPTTRTRRPAYGAGFRYSAECTSSPANDPGQSGR
jgi:hypothetical protein